MEINMKGRFIIDEELSHKDFILKLMKALKTENIHFVGETKEETIHNKK